MPPVFASSLPLAGTPADSRSAACKARVRSIAASRPNSAFLDLRADSPLTRDQGNFRDATHYNDVVARFVEDEIARVTKMIASRD
jgi:hypothetical protein